MELVLALIFVVVAFALCNAESDNCINPPKLNGF